MNLKSVIKNDFKLIRRDMILVMMGGFSVYLALALRFLLPWANNYLASIGILPVDGLADYYPLIMGFMNLWTCSVMGGSIFGFIILSEKDEETMRALFTSPMSPKQYMNFRILTTICVSFLMILIVFYVVQIDLLSIPSMLLLTLGGAMTGPIIMLFLVIISDGRIQGMNYSKFTSFVGFLILISWWTDEPLQFVFGLFPPYWISKAYWIALNSQEQSSVEWLIYLAIGLITQGVAIILLRNLFIKNIYKKL